MCFVGLLLPQEVQTIRPIERLDIGIGYSESLQQHAWKLCRDDMDWLVASEVRDRIIYVGGESWGMKEIGARRQRGRGEAMDGERKMLLPGNSNHTEDH